MALKRLDEFAEDKRPWYPLIKLAGECNQKYWWIFHVTVRCGRSDNGDGSLFILFSSEESRILIQVWKQYQGRWKWVKRYMYVLSGLLGFTKAIYFHCEWPSKITLKIELWLTVLQCFAWKDPCSILILLYGNSKMGQLFPLAIYAGQVWDIELR